MKRVVVTGAFSYTGAAVARELLARGYSVHTLTNRQPPSGAYRITWAPLRFDIAELVEQFAGADAFVNTFWVRLPHGGQSFETAVAQSRLLLEAAVRTSVRVVHVSVSNAASGRNLGYYRGKAEVEEAIRAAGAAYAIVRPTLIVGPADVLTNNIAWFLRRSPFFPLPGGGRYRLQPVTLRDVGLVVVDALEQSDNLEVDAAGQEVFTFADYVRLLADACAVRRIIVPVPRALALAALRIGGTFLRDVVLTDEELLGLEQELLLSHEPPRGRESVTAWLKAQGVMLGHHYVNDLGRHFESGATRAILDPVSLKPLAPW